MVWGVVFIDHWSILFLFSFFIRTDLTHKIIEKNPVSFVLLIIKTRNVVFNMVNYVMVKKTTTKTLLLKILSMSLIYGKTTNFSLLSPFDEREEMTKSNLIIHNLCVRRRTECDIHNRNIDSFSRDNITSNVRSPSPSIFSSSIRYITFYHYSWSFLSFVLFPYHLGPPSWDPFTVTSFLSLILIIVYIRLVFSFAFIYETPPLIRLYRSRQASRHVTVFLLPPLITIYSSSLSIRPWSTHRWTLYTISILKVGYT